MAIPMRMMLVAAALIVFAGCDESAPVIEDAERQALLAQDEKDFVASLAALRTAAATADSITLYRIAQPLDENYAQIEKRAKQKIAGYPILEQVALSKADAEPIVDLLTNRDTYVPPGWAGGCIFEPHHVLRTGDVVIVICVECGDVRFPTQTKSVRPGPNASLTRLLNERIRA